MSDPVRVGLIGCGRIAQLVHLDALGRSERLSLVAVAEPVAERRDEVARRLPAVRLLQGHDELLALPEVEAVLISLPNQLHAEVASASLRAGKHIYLEKPLATSLADGQSVVDLCRSRDLIGMIGFNYRFNPLHQQLRASIATTTPGSPLLIRTTFSSPPRDLEPWKRSRASGGGVLLDFASHHIDLLRFLTGTEVRTVSAEIRSLRSEEDTAVLQLELEGGVLVQSFFSTSATEQDVIEVTVSGGTLRLDRLRAQGLEFQPARKASGRVTRFMGELASVLKLPRRAVGALSSGFEPSFDACLDRFALAVRGSAEPSPDLEDGLRSLEVVEAAEESARSGQVVTLLHKRRE